MSWSCGNRIRPKRATDRSAPSRAESVFGIASLSELRSAANVADLAKQVRDKVSAVREAVNNLVPRLSDWYRSFEFQIPAATVCKQPRSRWAWSSHLPAPRPKR